MFYLSMRFISNDVQYFTPIELVFWIDITSRSTTNEGKQSYESKCWICGRGCSTHRLRGQRGFSPQFDLRGSWPRHLLCLDVHSKSRSGEYTWTSLPRSPRIRHQWGRWPRQRWRGENRRRARALHQNAADRRKRALHLVRGALPVILAHSANHCGGGGWRGTSTNASVDARKSRLQDAGNIRVLWIDLHHTIRKNSVYRLFGHIEDYGTRRDRALVGNDLHRWAECFGIPRRLREKHHRHANWADTSSQKKLNKAPPEIEALKKVWL